MDRHECHGRIVPFALEGQFLGFDPDDQGKRKYFHLATMEGEMQLKLAKPLRWSIGPQLSPGQWIRVQGEQKQKYDGEIKRKVWHLQVTEAGADLTTTLSPDRSTLLSPVQSELSTLAAAASDPAGSTIPEHPTPQPRLGTIQICRKSDCCKRGGTRVLQALEQSLKDHPEGDRIQVKPIGCIKNCKAGPNLVIMPSKARYSQVRAEDVPQLIQEHFPSPAINS